MDYPGQDEGPLNETLAVIPLIGTQGLAMLGKCSIIELPPSSGTNFLKTNFLIKKFIA